MNQTTSPAYVPGVCNINHQEIAYRRKVGFVGLALSIIVFVVLYALSVDQLYRVVLFLPIMVSASGFLQAKNKFCVGYGGAGKQNAEEGSANALTVTDQAALAKDKARTRNINLQTIGIAIVVTALVMLIPNF